MRVLYSALLKARTSVPHIIWFPPPFSRFWVSGVIIGIPFLPFSAFSSPARCPTSPESIPNVLVACPIRIAGWGYRRCAVWGRTYGSDLWTEPSESSTGTVLRMGSARAGGPMRLESSQSLLLGPEFSLFRLMALSRAGLLSSPRRLSRMAGKDLLLRGFLPL